MLNDIIEVRVLKDYVLYLRFEDGMEGPIDISHHVAFKGVFLKLKDKKYFATVRVSKDLGTIIWDDQIDLSPSFLYAIVANKVA